jgi:isocitrate dehydrogenase
MVNSDKGITNLHVPSDVIVDASMPAMIRTSGKCGIKMVSTRYIGIIPDRSYAGIYTATIDFVKKMVHLTQLQWECSNVGLMAQSRRIWFTR